MQTSFKLLSTAPKKQPDDILQDTHNDTTKQIHYDSYVYIHSPHKDNIKGEAELRGNDPKRLEFIEFIEGDINPHCSYPEKN